MPPLQGPLTFGLVFGAWYVAFGCAVAIPIVLGLSLVLRRLGGSDWSARAAGALGLLALVVLASRSPTALEALFRLDGPLRYRLLVPAALALCLLALGSLALAARKTRRHCARALGCFLLAFFPSREPAPSASGSEARRQPPTSSARFVLVGVDGADWRFLDPLIARGELPHFAALRGRGAWGPLKTIEPTRSPAIWTTVVTGKPPQEHGVLGFMDLRLRGVGGVLPPLVPPDFPGFARLHALLQSSGQLFETPVASSTRRVPAYWNIATQNLSPVNVVNWWATWPAERITGSMISELPFYRPREAAPQSGLTYPEELRAAIAKEIVTPQQIGLDEARRFADLTPAELAMMQGPTSALREAQWLVHFVSLFETTRRLALFVTDRGREQQGAPDLLVLLRLVDMTSHVALRDSELVTDHVGAADDEIRKYGRAVSEAYRATDRALGELVARFDGENVIVVSDHGFRVQQDGARRFYGHEDAPDGIFIAAGPAFRNGRVDGLSVYDILPLLLQLKGFAIADDFAGRVPRAAFDERFLAANPERHIASYGRRDKADVAPYAAVVDEEARRRLRALGYIN